MDPLSISASIVALAGAAASALAGVQKLSSLSGASDELLWMQNELTDLRAVLHVVDELLSSARAPLPLEGGDSLASLGMLASRTGETLRELEHFIDDKLVRKIGLDKNGKPFISKLAWLKHEAKMQRFRDRLRDSRVGISLHLSMLSTRRVSAVHYDIQGLSESCRQIQQALQQGGPAQVRHTTVVVAESASDPEDGTVSESQTEETVTVDSSAEPEGQPSSSVTLTLPPPHIDSRTSRGPGTFSIDAVVSSGRCRAACNCQCHIRSNLQSPTWLRRVVGSLFISYSGIPCIQARTCNLRSCRRSKKSSLQVSYIFPTTLLSKMFSFTAVWNDLIGVQMTLVAPTVIPPTSGTWRIIQVDNPASLKVAFDKGEAFPTDVNTAGATLLHFAMENQAYKTAAMLLKCGADPDATDSYNRTPALEAWHLIRVMTEDERNMLSPLFTTEEDVIQRFCFSTVHQVILGIMPREVFDMPALIEPLLDSADTLGWTPLHWAVNFEDVEAISRLTALGCAVDVPNNLGETALHIACMAGSVECAGLLLAAGACVSATTETKWTPLHYAVRSRRISLPLLQLLLEHGAQIGARALFGHTALHMGHGDPDVVRLFLDHGAPMDDLNDNGYTALTFAVSYDAARSVSFLLGAGANVKPVNIWSHNILHLAACGASLTTLKCLIESDLDGVDPDLVDVDGDTPLQSFHSESRLLLAADEREKEEERVVFETLVDKARARWVMRDIAGSDPAGDETAPPMDVWENFGAA